MQKKILKKKKLEKKLTFCDRKEAEVMKQCRVFQNRCSQTSSKHKYANAQYNQLNVVAKLIRSVKTGLYIIGQSTISITAL